LPFIEQAPLHRDIAGYQYYLMGQRQSDSSKMVGSSTPKTYISPLDTSPYQYVNWAWPYTGGGATYQMGLVSYAPNLRVFGQISKVDWAGGMSWAVMWWHTGAGNPRVAIVSDGLSNTMFVAEKNMVTGTGTMYYQDWSVNGGAGGGAGGGIQMWATTDTPETGLPVFGIACDDPSVTWDDEYGQWWLKTCNFSGPYETFQPPRRRLIAAQQSVYTIYPMSSGGVQVAMGDGSVRTVSTNVSVASWSAAMTPNGGESIGLN